MKRVMKSSLALIMAVALVMGANPLSVVPQKAEASKSVVEVSSWEALQSTIKGASTVENNPTEIKLTGTMYGYPKDIKPGKVYTGPLIIPAGRHVVLDLNGHHLDRDTDNNPQRDYVIKVCGTLTVKNSQATALQDNCIYGGDNTGKGGCVIVESGATFNLTAGMLSENDTSGDGAGVYVKGNGTFNMSGGNIGGNTAGLTGGGVYVERNATFNMTGGEINSNTAGRDGSGVYVDGGTFNMTGGKIFSSYFGRDGGGVYVKSGKFKMTGGDISMSNPHLGSKGNGGGVYVDGGTFEMSGGEIHENRAGGDGGGVYLKGGEFCVSGTPVVRNNYEKIGYGRGNMKNIYIGQGAKMYVTGALTNGAELWIDYYNESSGVAYPGAGYKLTENDAAKFHNSDNSNLCSVVGTDGSSNPCIKFIKSLSGGESKSDSASDANASGGVTGTAGAIFGGPGMIWIVLLGLVVIGVGAGTAIYIRKRKKTE